MHYNRYRFTASIQGTNVWGREESEMWRLICLSFRRKRSEMGPTRSSRFQQSFFCILSLNIPLVRQRVSELEVEVVAFIHFTESIAVMLIAAN